VELAAEMITLAEALGQFPHAKLDPAPAGPEPGPGTAGTPGRKIHSGLGKQGTRVIKLAAVGCCGYTVRTTAKWLAEGSPLCPHGTPMTRG
jgi:hypothetical protein